MNILKTGKMKPASMLRKVAPLGAQSLKGLVNQAMKNKKKAKPMASALKSKAKSLTKLMNY
jgi:hypothetical protein